MLLNIILPQFPTSLENIEQTSITHTSTIMKIGKQAAMPHTGYGSYSRIKPKSRTRVNIEND